MTRGVARRHAAKTDLPTALDVDVTTHGRLPGAAEYARSKISELARLTHRPVLHARVKMTRHPDPAVERPVVAQGNSTWTAGSSAPRSRAPPRAKPSIGSRRDCGAGSERTAEHWEARRGELAAATPHERRHQSEPTHRPRYYPRPVDDRRIIRHKLFTLAACTGRRGRPGDGLARLRVPPFHREAPPSPVCSTVAVRRATVWH